MSLLQKSTLLLLAGLLLAAVGVGVYLYRVPPASPPVETVNMSVQSRACRDGEGICRASHPLLGELQLRFPGGAYYMQAFEAELSISGNEAVEAVSLDLTMPGMDMGRNRFALKRDDSGSWRGKLLLPICVTGRVDWQVTVQMDTAERRYEAVFPLNVTRAPQQ